MSKESEIENEISNLKESTSRLYGQVHMHEDYINSGQDDPRHLQAIGSCYKQIEQNAFDRGKLEARLEMMHERAAYQDDRDSSKSDDRLIQEEDRKDSENWWRSSQADERPEPTPEDERDDARYRR